MIYDKTLFVYKLRDNASSSNFESYVAFSGFRGPGGIQTAAIRANIQPAGPEKTVLVEGVLGKTFEAYTLSSGITEGMVLVASGSGDRFKVRGRQNYDYGMGQHNELVISKGDIT